MDFHKKISILQTNKPDTLIDDIGIAKTLPIISGSETGHDEQAIDEPLPGEGLTRLCRTFNVLSLIVLSFFLQSNIFIIVFDDNSNNTVINFILSLLHHCHIGQLIFPQLFLVVNFLQFPVRAYYVDIHTRSAVILKKKSFNEQQKKPKIKSYESSTGRISKEIKKTSFVPVTDKTKKGIFTVFYSVSGVLYCTNYLVCAVTDRTKLIDPRIAMQLNVVNVIIGLFV